jgi:hypothetical protein
VKFLEYRREDGTIVQEKKTGSLINKWLVNGIPSKEAYGHIYELHIDLHCDRKKFDLHIYFLLCSLCLELPIVRRGGY